jgi:hypothetical protein
VSGFYPPAGYPVCTCTDWPLQSATMVLTLCCVEEECLALYPRQTGLDILCLPGLESPVLGISTVCGTKKVMAVSHALLRMAFGVLTGCHEWLH